MTWGDIVVIIVLAGGYFLYEVFKKSPKHFLERKLEKFKSELQTNIDSLRISAESIHPMKIEEYVEFSKAYLKLMELGKITNPKEVARKQKEVFDGMSRFGFAVMFFGNDDTVKKYVEFRKYSTLPAGKLGENEKAKIMMVMSELIVLMRRDVGHNDSEVTVDDFLTIIVNDWETSKEKFKERASNAIKV